MSISFIVIIASIARLAAAVSGSLIASVSTRGTICQLAAALRRAYLRTLKRHNPEQDPEGFRRVREAFELLGRLQNVLAASLLDLLPVESAIGVPQPPPAADEPDSALLDLIAETGPARDTAELRCEQALHALHSGDLDAAHRAALETIALSREDTSDRGYLISLVPLALRLVEAGKPGHGSEVFADLAAELHSSGMEARLAPFHATQFALASELVALPCCCSLWGSACSKPRGRGGGTFRRSRSCRHG